MPDKKNPANLKTVAARVGLAPCSVSSILNNTAAAQAIPQATKDRVIRAAAELNYRPNVWARSLRTKRTCMIAAVTPDFGCAMVARVVAGAQKRLHRKGYLLMLESLDAAENHTRLQQSGVEGIISVDAAVPRHLDLPVASVEVGYIAPGETMTHEMQSWLSELGETAAETIVRQIENPGPLRKMRVEAKYQPEYFSVPDALDSDIRETA